MRVMSAAISSARACIAAMARSQRATRSRTLERRKARARSSVAETVASSARLTVQATSPV
jgi:hypothetical protein